MRLQLSFLFIICLLFCTTTNAQLEKGKYIDISLGYGISAAYDETEVVGEGFYFQTEYVFAIKKWFQLRPYAGFIFTSVDKDERNLSSNKVTSNAFLIGGKARISAPIPYVAPFFETGLGASIGKFVTNTPLTTNEGSGVFLHIPVSLGLALGRKNNIELEFTYYFHPLLKQFSGAAAIGLTIPLNNG